LRYANTLNSHVFHPLFELYVVLSYLIILND
jgi:hypothetical protein